MDIKGSVALVTGANRGLGKALVDALFAAGAAKVYAAARQLGDLDPRAVSVSLDVTDETQIASLASQCPDLTLLVNNAGIFEAGPLDGSDSVASLRRQIEVNAVGPLAMANACGPIIASNGGGAIVNILSVSSWFTAPMATAYSASKHAALAISDGMRMTWRDRGVEVSGVYAGFIDTDMTKSVDVPKSSPEEIAEAVMRGVAAGEAHIFADQRSRSVWAAVREDPYAFMETLVAQSARE